MKSVLAIDTGNAKMGYAYWHEADSCAVSKPSLAGIIKAAKLVRSTQVESAKNAVSMFSNLLDIVQSKYTISSKLEIVLEAQVIRNDAVGITAHKDILNLSSCVGAITAFVLLSSDSRYSVKCVQPVQWKGQLSKRATIRRITRMLGDNKALDGTTLVHDAWDATGIGLYALGHRLDDVSKIHKS